MRIHTSEAIVLRHIDYGEADRIVIFYARDLGLFKGFARNARSSRRRFGAALEPFAGVRVQWQRNSAEGLANLREVELEDLRAGLRARLDALTLAAYGCELVEELFGDGEPHPEVFDVLGAFLDAAAQGGEDPAALRLLLELRLLWAAGYVPHLLHCASCGCTGDGEVLFDATRGGRLCLDCGAGAVLRLSPLTLGTLARCLKTPQDAFRGFRFGEQSLREGSAALSDCLRLHLHRPLRTLVFLERFLVAPEAREAR
ncbi:DNA repair protein RecO [Geoalkalibacter halelectricus]|uniref:DNA repair protein RecO n=1 Tax=Geoalkalibacter halelectricus TaxID=2847045 RepID=A0ABY5ZL84_9BACT|nr:DNA repair protein RecO [Geoalkalibacter halelectricus]MDO3378773.1 DNA repair protein RecO [Geoalkalibacter halelectricus]UWZ79922.1 DNA repair protein RecO [Geoalkalibacter halelectricus]